MKKKFNKKLALIPVLSVVILTILVFLGFIIDREIVMRNLDIRVAVNNQYGRTGGWTSSPPSDMEYYGISMNGRVIKIDKFDYGIKNVAEGGFNRDEYVFSICEDGEVNCREDHDGGCALSESCVLVPHDPNGRVTKDEALNVNAKEIIELIREHPGTKVVDVKGSDGEVRKMFEIEVNKVIVDGGRYFVIASDNSPKMSWADVLFEYMPNEHKVRKLGSWEGSSIKYIEAIGD